MRNKYTLREALEVFGIKVPSAPKKIGSGEKLKKQLSLVEVYVYNLFRFQQEIESWTKSDKKLAELILENCVKNQHNITGDFPVYLTMKKVIYRLSDYELQQECVNLVQSCQLSNFELIAMSLIAAKSKNLIHAIEYAECGFDSLGLGDHEIASMVHAIIEIYLSEIDLIQEVNNCLEISNKAELFGNISQLLAACELNFQWTGDNENIKKPESSSKNTQNATKEIRPSIKKLLRE